MRIYRGEEGSAFMWICRNLHSSECKDLHSFKCRDVHSCECRNVHLCECREMKSSCECREVERVLRSWDCRDVLSSKCRNVHSCECRALHSCECWAMKSSCESTSHSHSLRLSRTLYRKVERWRVGVNLHLIHTFDEEFVWILVNERCRFMWKVEPYIHVWCKWCSEEPAAHVNVRMCRCTFMERLSATLMWRWIDAELTRIYRCEEGSAFMWICRNLHSCECRDVHSFKCKDVHLYACVEITFMWLWRSAFV